MTTRSRSDPFRSSRLWSRAAHRQALPVDVLDGPRRGVIANVLGYRRRSGETVVTVTWRAHGRLNLSSAHFSYGTPREALDAGWELGAAFEADALHAERMARKHG
jgi:hypothetical protein